MKVVDIFCGAGGFSEGAVLAGATVAVAENHWPLAVDSHKLNHPGTVHWCQDAALADHRRLPPYDALLASPACQGHSPARGKDEPRHDASRATAWVVIDVVEQTRPRALAVENVPAFLGWNLYPMWRDALAQLGYVVTVNHLNAADFGVPQDRRRVMITALRGRACPALEVKPTAHRPFAGIQDAAGRFSRIDRPGRAPATLARIAAGRRAFGERFLIPYYGSGSGETGRSLDRPIGTITTKARWAVVDGDRMRMVSIPECKRAMAFREDYQLLGTVADQHKQLGNAVPPPMACAVVAHLRECA